MITNENLAYRSSRRDPASLGRGAGSFKRLLGRQRNSALTAPPPRQIDLESRRNTAGKSNACDLELRSQCAAHWAPDYP